VSESTLGRAANMGMGISVFLIDEWYDVDTLEDMMRLKRDLEKPLNGSFDCENTYGMMGGIDI